MNHGAKNIHIPHLNTKTSFFLKKLFPINNDKTVKVTYKVESDVERVVATAIPTTNCLLKLRTARK